MCDTLNKIVQKLNFERSEAEHFATVQRVEIKNAQKLRESIKGQLMDTKSEGKEFYVRARGDIGAIGNSIRF